MKPITLVFQIHHPHKLRLYRFFDIGNDHYYYDDFANESSIRKKVAESYLPANRLLQHKIANNKGKLKVAFLISGSALELFRRYSPEMLESFKQLMETEQVEFLGTTSSNSIASLYDMDVFANQVRDHSNVIDELTGLKPQVFINSGMIYSNEIGAEAKRLGFKAAFIDDSKKVLGWRSPNQIYGDTTKPNFKLLVRNSLLNNRLIQIFSDNPENGAALSVDNFLSALVVQNADDQVINLGFDYEILCHGQPHNSSGFRVFNDFLSMVIHSGKVAAILPSEAVSQFPAVASLSVPNPVTFNYEEEHGIAKWMGNELQNEALSKLFRLSEMIRKCPDTKIIHDWNNLQDISHFNAMSSYRRENGWNHTQHETFINYMNILSDLELRLEAFRAADQKTQILQLKQKLKEQDSLIKECHEEIKTLNITK
ncbi:MAG: hypothetical protein FWG22_02080 [Prolixibacteraceae bacterium]|nr:hypothetical protein [Prolixibacteraceae bacterium]